MEEYELTRSIMHVQICWVNLQSGTYSMPGVTLPHASWSSQPQYGSREAIHALAREKNSPKSYFSLPKRCWCPSFKGNSGTGPYFLHDPCRSHRLRGILTTQLEKATNRAWCSLSSCREMTLLSSSLSALHLFSKNRGRPLC